MPNKIIKELEKEIHDLFHSESSGHDIHHLKRVYNLALHLQKKEGGDRLVIGVAAFLHDIHRIIQKEKGEYCSPEKSLPTIKKILGKTNLSKNKIERILHCIKYHEEYNFSNKGKTVKDIETLMVQDADNLDAMGAIGIGRTFVFSGSYGVPMWAPHIPFNKKTWDESSDLDASTIHHFYNKLLKLKDNMNTKTAKKMALERHKFMKIFLKEFFSEWQGKK